MGQCLCRCGLPASSDTEKVSDRLAEKGEMEIDGEGNLASCQPGSLCQFVPTEEAQVSVEGPVTGELTDHTYAAGPRPPLHTTR